MPRLGHRLGHLGPGHSSLRRRTSRATVVTAALLLGCLASAAPASALLSGEVLPTSTVSTGTWGATPTATSVASAPNCQAAPSSCTAFSAGGTGSPWSAYFDVWNTGTEALAGLSYMVTLTGGTAPTMALTACSMPWDAGTGYCPGVTVTVLAASPAGTFPVVTGVPAAPGAVAYLQVTVANAPTVVTISTSVAPSQVVTATTNN